MSIVVTYYTLFYDMRICTQHLVLYTGVRIPLKPRIPRYHVSYTTKKKKKSEAIIYILTLKLLKLATSLSLQ